jgi:drug/metabolite transporter (DMT)-like permease
MQRVSGNIIAFAAMFLWATQFPAMALIVGDWDPVLMAPFRAGSSGIFLLFVLLATGGAHHMARVPWLHVMWIGGIVLTGSTIFFIWGQKQTHPVTAAIIVSLMPLISAAIGYLTKRERLTVPIGLGIVLAVAGAYLTNLEPGAGLFGFVLQGGEPYMLASVILFVWYSRETAERLTGISETAQAGFTLAFACLGSTIVAVAAVGLGVVDPVYDLSLKSVGIIAWCGAIAIGLAMALWFAAIKRIGVTVTTMHHNLVPFYVIVFASLGGGAVYGTQAWGAFLVFLGAALAQLPITAWLRRRGAATRPAAAREPVRSEPRL